MADDECARCWDTGEWAHCWDGAECHPDGCLTYGCPDCGIGMDR